MSNLIFNLRIGKLHIQISTGWRLSLKINNVHRWTARPIVKLYR